MQHFLESNTPFPWKKKGLVYYPDDESYSHGSHPCAVHLKDDIYLIAFTRRDLTQRSHIFLSYAHIDRGKLELISEPKLCLWPGEPGCFDCDGVISVCLVKHKEIIYLYYVGWQNLPEGMWICDTGRAIVNPDDLMVNREFQGPVLGRDKNNPLFAAATAFHVTEDKWQTWYNSGVKWKKKDGGWHHRYGIHYAESDDGVDWHCHPEMCIPFADEYEYAFGRPSVIRKNGIFYMWFAHRATKDIETYRIGFATSHDGRNWSRNDAIAGIDVSTKGWDSQMICYPCVFEHKKWFYMLYNGNHYGKTGFGLATMEVEF
jgi:hypothetical protein